MCSVGNGNKIEGSHNGSQVNNFEIWIKDNGEYIVNSSLYS